MTVYLTDYGVWGRWPFDLCIVGARAWFTLPAVSQTRSRSGLVLARASSPVLLIIFMDRISRCSQVAEGVKFGGLRIPSLLFTDDEVLLASSNIDLQPVLRWFALTCEAVGMRISSPKSEQMVLSRKKVDCQLGVREELLLQVKEFKYWGVLLWSERKMEWEIDRWIGAGSAVVCCGEQS